MSSIETRACSECTNFTAPRGCLIHGPAIGPNNHAAFAHKTCFEPLPDPRPLIHLLRNTIAALVAEAPEQTETVSAAIRLIHRTEGI